MLIKLCNIQTRLFRSWQIVQYISQLIYQAKKAGIKQMNKSEEIPSQKDSSLPSYALKYMRDRDNNYLKHLEMLDYPLRIKKNLISTKTVSRTVCLTPKILAKLNKQSFQKELTNCGFRIIDRNRQFLAQFCLSIDSGHNIFLISKQKPVDSIKIGQICFLCRFRTQPFQINSGDKLANWNKTLERGTKSRLLLENGNYVFYSPQPDTLSKSLENMIKDLNRDKWRGNYIAFFLPKNLQKQFFILQVISAINQLKSSLAQRFQFIIFQTDLNSDFKKIISNLRNPLYHEFKRQWFWINKAKQRVSYSYKVCAQIQSAAGDLTLILDALDYGPQTNSNPTHKLQVNLGHLKYYKNDRNFQVTYRGGELNCQLYNGQIIELPRTYLEDPAFKSFIKNLQIIDSQYNEKVNNRQRYLQNLNIIIKCFTAPPPQVTKEQIIMKKKQAWVQTRLGIFKIDKKAMKQINMFSGVSKNIECINIKHQKFFLQQVHSFTFVQLQANEDKQKDLDQLLQQRNICSLNMTKIEQNLNPQLELVNFPDYWDRTKTNRVQMINVDRTTAEYEFIQKHFTIRKEFKAQRIQNIRLFQSYFNVKSKLQRDYGQGLAEKYLFHGTKNTHPSSIYEGHDVSFNINFAQSGYRGKGIYFAKEASYSDAYAHKLNYGQKCMLMCVVLIGFYQKINTKVSILEPQFRDKINQFRYDSVFSNYDGSDIYVVYRSDRAYPLYLITYK